MYKFGFLLCALAIVTIILSLSIENYFYNQRIQKIDIIERSLELEKAYIEELQNLPPCKYDASVYNGLLNSNSKR